LISERCNIFDNLSKISLSPWWRFDFILNNNNKEKTRVPPKFIVMESRVWILPFTNIPNYSQMDLILSVLCCLNQTNCQYFHCTSYCTGASRPSFREPLDSSRGLFDIVAKATLLAHFYYFIYLMMAVLEFKLRAWTC
jgi:hypothetical protein